MLIAGEFHKNRPFLGTLPFYHSASNLDSTSRDGRRFPKIALTRHRIILIPFDFMPNQCYQTYMDALVLGPGNIACLVILFKQSMTSHGGRVGFNWSEQFTSNQMAVLAGFSPIRRYNFGAKEMFLYPRHHKGVQLIARMSLTEL